MKFHLYTGNHGNGQGIEEFVTMLSDLMVRNKLAFTMSQSFCPDATNIVIDEFTSVLTVKELKAFRNQHPKARVVFLLTEFFHQKCGFESFNNFGDWREQSLLAVFNLVCKWKRPDLGRIHGMDYFKALLGVPHLSLRVIGHFLQKSFLFWKKLPSFMKKVHRNLYLHMRYLGLIENIRLADGVLVSHPAIAAQVNDRYPNLPFLGCLYPEFGDFTFNDDAFRALDNSIEVTGSVTPYRYRFIEKVNTDLSVLGIRAYISGCFDQGFDSQCRKEHRGAFSLHIPQSAAWPYASPTRIFRALVKDQNIPLLSRHFGQHPIEDCALLLEGISTYGRLSDFYRAKQSPSVLLNEKIQTYDTLARQANRRCIEQLKELNSSTTLPQTGKASLVLA